MNVDKREALGFVVMGLLILSLVVSLIPVKARSSDFFIKGPQYFTKSVEGNEISLKVNFGELRVISSGVSSPQIQGHVLDVERDSYTAGEVRLEVPSGWNGRAELSINMGKLFLDGPSVGELEVKASFGDVEGLARVKKSLTIEGSNCNVDVTVEVPKETKVVLDVNGADTVVSIDGRYYKDGKINVSVGEGPEVTIRVSGDRVRLTVIRG